MICLQMLFLHFIKAEEQYATFFIGQILEKLH